MEEQDGVDDEEDKNLSLHKVAWEIRTQHVPSRRGRKKKVDPALAQKNIPPLKWETRNLTRIKSTGIELSGDFYPEQILNRKIFITKLGINYSYNQLDKGNINLLSYYVLDNLKQKLDLEVNHNIIWKLKGSWRISYQDRNGMRTSTEPFDPFWLVNARIFWKSPSSEIYLIAANLMDKKYYDYGTVEQPGRWISLGVSHSLGNKRKN
jgi:iron complex outermembrane receptor protein